MAFNSEEYGWNDLTVQLLGRPVIGLRGVKYGQEQDKQNVYGKGKRPIARARGQVTYEGEIKVLLSELRALLQSEGNGRSLVGIRPFDVVVVYAAEAGGALTTDILKYCEFTKAEIDLNQGDAFVEITLPIIIGDIEWNV